MAFNADSFFGAGSGELESSISLGFFAEAADRDDTPLGRADRPDADVNEGGGGSGRFLLTDDVGTAEKDADGLTSSSSSELLSWALHSAALYAGEGIELTDGIESNDTRRGGAAAEEDELRFLGFFLNAGRIEGGLEWKPGVGVEAGDGDGRGSTWCECGGGGDQRR